MNLRNNLFGQGPRASRGEQQPAGYGRAPAPPPREDTAMAGYDDPRGGYGGRPEKSPLTSPRQAFPTRQAAGGRGPMSPRKAQLSIAKIDDKTKANQYIFGNL